MSGAPGRVAQMPALRWLLAALPRVGLLVAAVMVAWVLSNGAWSDPAPALVPAELQPRPVGLRPADNGFFDLQALTVAHGADPNAAGQRRLGLEPKTDTVRLDWPASPLWSCQAAESDCIQAWRLERTRLVAELAQAEPLVARCETLLARPGIEEVLTERITQGPLAQRGYAAYALPVFQHLTRCATAFNLQAVLADSPQASLQRFAMADRLLRGALAGSRSLLGHNVAVSALRRQWILLSQWSAQLKSNEARPDRAALAALLAPLPAELLNPRTWVPGEAHFGGELLRDLTGPGEAGCAQSDGGLDIAQILCRLRLGLLPEQTLVDAQAQWMVLLATVPVGQPLSCDTARLPAWGPGDDEAGFWRHLHWRNTLGRWLLQVRGSYSEYLARAIDLELIRVAASLAVAGTTAPLPAGIVREGDALAVRGCALALDPDSAPVIRVPVTSP